jgi:SAM-dependent methyltransferase
MSRPIPGAVSYRACPACHRVVERFLPGPRGKRVDATCPHCRSKERHRFLALLLEGLGPVYPSARVVLDIAPSKQTARILGQKRPARYIRMDLEPAADGRDVDVQGSMTAIPLHDGSVDLAICYHVLEHIPDDLAALAELQRVLAPGGTAFVQVPWRPDRLTEEDSTATEEERVRRFGQHDHVRYYGRDFEDRVRGANLAFTRVTPREIVGVRLCWFFALIPDEAVWLVRRDDASHYDVPAESVRLPTLAYMYGLLDDAEERNAKAVSGERAARDALVRLRSKWSVRAAVTLRRRLKITALRRADEDRRSNSTF